jgi:hypothetical protein
LRGVQYNLGIVGGMINWSKSSRHFAPTERKTPMQKQSYIKTIAQANARIAVR